MYSLLAHSYFRYICSTDSAQTHTSTVFFHWNWCTPGVASITKGNQFNIGNNWKIYNWREENNLGLILIDLIFIIVRTVLIFILVSDWYTFSSIIFNFRPVKEILLSPHHHHMYTKSFYEFFYFCHLDWLNCKSLSHRLTHFQIISCRFI